MWLLQSRDEWKAFTKSGRLPSDIPPTHGTFIAVEVGSTLATGWEKVIATLRTGSGETSKRQGQDATSIVARHLVTRLNGVMPRLALRCSGTTGKNGRPSLSSAESHPRASHGRNVQNKRFTQKPASPNAYTGCHQFAKECQGILDEFRQYRIVRRSDSNLDELAP